MTHVRCRKCQARRTLPRYPDEYLRKPPRCRTAGCRSTSYRVDRYRDQVECGGKIKPCYPGRGGCDGLAFPHRRGSLGCEHHPAEVARRTADDCVPF